MTRPNHALLVGDVPWLGCKANSPDFEDFTSGTWHAGTSVESDDDRLHVVVPLVESSFVSLSIWNLSKLFLDFAQMDRST